MPPAFISTWPSCGGGRCRGVQPGRALDMTAWTILDRNIRCQTLLRRLTWDAGFRHGQSPGRYGTRPWSHMSPVFRPTSYCLARVVCPWYTITRCSAIVQCTHPCVGRLWLNLGNSLSRRWPNPDGSPIVYRSGEISYRRRRLLFAAFCKTRWTVSPVVPAVSDDDGDPTDMIVEVIWLWIQPVNRPQTPVNNDSQLVVELPSHYEVPAEPDRVIAALSSDTGCTGEGKSRDIVSTITDGIANDPGSAIGAKPGSSQRRRATG